MVALWANKLGLKLKTAIEAAVTVVNDSQVYFVGGRQDNGDTKDIWKIEMNQPLDLAEIELIGSIQHARCLHKGILTQDKIIVLGGVNFASSEILDKKTFQSIQIPATSNLCEKAAEISFNDFFLKKCSAC